MKYAKCKCGECERWDSGYPIFECQGCTKCGTTLAHGPSGHKPLKPHTWKEIVKTTKVDGKVVDEERYKVCDVCGYEERQKSEENNT